MTTLLSYKEPPHRRSTPVALHTPLPRLRFNRELCSKYVESLTINVTNLYNGALFAAWIPNGRNRTFSGAPHQHPLRVQPTAQNQQIQATNAGLRQKIQQIFRQRPWLISSSS
ncbi:hypothetical protein E9531_05810 [Lampropedia puyangensis]|uniref:Uncharacterized protein n=1 Tax=Lampropedia puyangensis TaxID=1330072 RepID=A0A4S8FCX2_9BURK|nr:hypothetical protein E9531_05810 [Lampropedia puyangensis]